MVHINQNLYKLQGDNFLNSPAFHGQKHFFMRISKLFKILGNALSVDEMIFQSVIQEYCLSATENLSQTLSRVIIILHLARLLEVIEDEQRNKPSWVFGYPPVIWLFINNNKILSLQENIRKETDINTHLCYTQYFSVCIGAQHQPRTEKLD